MSRAHLGKKNGICVHARLESREGAPRLKNGISPNWCRRCAEEGCDVCGGGRRRTIVALSGERIVSWRTD